MINKAGLGIAYQTKPKVRDKSYQHPNYSGLKKTLYLLGIKSIE